MRLAASHAASDFDLDRTVAMALDRRLRRDAARPVVVALSGGGDSLALLLASQGWATAAGRRLLVLTVDHRLRPQSRSWTQACRATAERLGLAFQPLAWEGDKPAIGLPAAARDARHKLLADAARAAGARVILMGHTADDVLEARLMRQAGSTTPEPREWSPSPAWPQGRGLFLLRPLLQARRAAIRQWLVARGERWIDDPANEDPAFARPRARAALAAGAEGGAPRPVDDGAAAALARTCRLDAAGGLEIDREALLRSSAQGLARFMAAASLCAAGTVRPPARASVERVAARLHAGPDFTASLAGARIEVRGGLVRIRREPGEAARGGLQPLRLAAGEPGVWDGRFEVVAPAACEVRAKPGTVLPVGDGGGVLRLRPLAHERLLAACGAIEREPA